MWVPDLSVRKGPRYLAIVESLDRAVAEGEIGGGERLPTHRALARELGVTVGTVSRAYAEAERRGLVRGEVGRGTFVRQRGEGGSVLDLVELANSDRFLDLGLNLPPCLDGGPDAAALAAAVSEVAGEGGLGRLLGYAPHAGSLPHREAGAEWMSRYGVTADPERVLVTCGAQHAMSAIFSALARPGDGVLSEALTYPGMKALANLLHLELRGVEMDSAGILPEALAEACGGARPPRFLYLVPNLHNPTNAVLPEARRREIVEIARRHDLLIVEDDVHGRLLDQAPPALVTLAPERTFFIANTSKSLAPGLRVGFVLAPEGTEERVAAGIWCTTWMAAPLMAEIAARWIADGTAEALLARRRERAAERQALVARAFAGQRLDAHPGSYYVWLHLPEPWRFEDYALQARQRGIGVTLPTAFAVGRGAVPHAVRICLGGAANRERLVGALDTLAALLAEPPDPGVCIA